MVHPAEAYVEWKSTEYGFLFSVAGRVKSLENGAFLTESMNREEEPVLPHWMPHTLYPDEPELLILNLQRLIHLPLIVNAGAAKGADSRENTAGQAGSGPQIVTGHLIQQAAGTA